MEKFLHKLLNNKCYLCNQKGDSICISCLTSLSPRPFFNFSHKYPLISFYKYEGLAKEILHMSKYPPYYFYLLKFLSDYTFSNKFQVLRRFLPPNLNKVIISEIPISKDRVFERGFNQASIIANSLSEILRIDKYDFFKRTKNTRPLFDFSFEQRQKEVHLSIKVKSSIQLLKIFQKDTFLIVDDVFTSGSTMMEASRALNLCGFKQIYYVTLFTI